MFKVCSRCGQEYQSWAIECTDCRVSLDIAAETLAPAVSPAPAPAAPLEDLVVLRLGGPWELQSLAETLQAQGISSRIDMYPPGGAITWSGAGSRNQPSGLGIYVSRRDREAARALADELAARELPDAEAPPPNTDPNSCPACGEPTPENAASCSACGLAFPEVPAEDSAT
ncbi:MAG TPA: hypothetical protein VKH41_08690 [Myxococcota bacterium]|nr:hypothetical protein [Myxococcota bacterium]